MRNNRVNSAFPLGRLLLVSLLAGMLGACQTPSISSPGPGSEPSAGSEPQSPPPAAADNPYQYGIYAILAGELAMQGGDLAEAAAWFARAAEVTGRVELHRKAVKAALGAKAGPAAETYADRWRQAVPDSPDPLLALAQARLLQGDTEGTVAALGSLVEAHGELDGLWLDAGERLSQTAGVTPAVKVLGRLTERYPDKAAAHLGLGHLLSRLGRRDRAARSLRRALELRPDWEAAAVELARTRSAREGLKILERFLADHPRAQEARLRYAQGLLATGRPGEAAEVFDTLAERHPESAEVFNGLGLSRFHQKAWEGARVAFRRVLELDPGNNAALFHLGRVAEEKGEIEAAVDLYSRVGGGRFLERARMREAVLAVRTGELQRALRLVRGMRSYHPQEPEYYRLEARILSEMEQLRAAEQVASQGLQRNPGNVPLLYTRAVIRDEQGNFAGMEADIRRVIKQDPEDARAYNFLGYSLADRGVRLKEALSLLEKANRLAPDQGYITDSLGWVHYRLGNLEKAERLLRRARELSKEDAEILSHLGEVLAAQGRREEARGIWREALDRADPDSELARRLQRRLRGDAQ